jgi:hypothetical protein
MSRSAILFCLVAALAGCGRSQALSTPKSRGERVAYRELGHQSGYSYVNVLSLCKLLPFFREGAGLYRVKKLTGVTEEMYGRPGVYDGFTYVEFELLNDWSGNAPKNPIARIAGGPDGNGATRSFDVELAVGETVGLLLRKLPDNYGYFSLEPSACWKAAGGGLTNGLYFTKTAVDASRLGAIIRELWAAGGSCQHDVLPDIHAAEQTQPRGADQVFAGTSQSEHVAYTTATAVPSSSSFDP